MAECQLAFSHQLQSHFLGVSCFVCGWFLSLKLRMHKLLGPIIWASSLYGFVYIHDRKHTGVSLTSFTCRSRAWGNWYSWKSYRDTVLCLPPSQ